MDGWRSALEATAARCLAGTAGKAVYGMRAHPGGPRLPRLASSTTTTAGTAIIAKMTTTIPTMMKSSIKPTPNMTTRGA